MPVLQDFDVPFNSKAREPSGERAPKFHTIST